MLGAQQEPAQRVGDTKAPASPASAAAHQAKKQQPPTKYQACFAPCPR